MPPAETELKAVRPDKSVLTGKAKEKGADHSAPGSFCVPPGRVDPVITCTFTDRWVASNALYRFQHPTANSSREACEPRIDPASRITKCGLKKGLSRTAQELVLL